MRMIDSIKKVAQTSEFNRKITDVAVLSTIIFIIPLIFYVNFIVDKVYHPISIISNYVLLVILFVSIPFFKKIPFVVKRGLFFILLYYFGIKAMLLGNLEFMSTIFIILISYTLLTSSLRTSIVLVSSAFVMYLLYPILFYFKLISFFYDPEFYHYDIDMLFVRTFEVMIGAGFMTALVYYVFKNNNNNIALLKKQVDESNVLNKKLLGEVGERKKAEVLAEQQANNFNSLFNNSYDGYAMLDKDFNIVDVNQSILNMTGFSYDDLIGNSGWIFIHKEYHDIIKQRREFLLKGGKLPDLCIEGVTKTGKRLVVYAQNIIIGEPDNISFLVVLKDITEQTIASEKLLKSEQIYRTLFEQTNESILIMDGDKLVEHNNVAHHLYKDIDQSQESIPYAYPYLELEGLNATVNLSEKIELTLNGVNQSFEWKHFSDSDKPVYTLVNLQAMEELGSSYYMVVEKDITERKRNQNLVLSSIIQTEENERKRISSDLHDGIGPILTTIKLYTQALLDESNPEKQIVIKGKLMNLVEEAVNSTSEIAFNISPHILINYGIVAAVESFINKFSISEKMEIEFSHNKVGRFDENKEITIYRLFTELINNTIKHANASQVVFDINEDQYFIKLFYSDNGVGFDPREVISNTVGMGLGNLKSRIQSFNGEFLLKSSHGNGVKVNIKIPKDKMI